MIYHLYFPIQPLMAAMCAGLICSCSPQVVTELHGNFPAQSADSVMIFGPSETPPDHADTVGNIRVTDAGLTAQCHYAQVLQKAVERTAASGGNALCINQHLKPDVWSSCHRIKGTMLLLPKGSVKVSSQDEIWRVDSLRDEDVAGTAQNASKTADNLHNRLSVSAGLTWITSKIYVTPTDYYSNRRCWDLCADYEYLWNSGFGVGLNYALNHASFNHYGSFTQHYIGPSFVYVYRITRRFSSEVGLGLGYSYYSESGGYTDSAMGVMFKVGMEYLFTRHFGLGLQYRACGCSYTQPDGFELPKNEQYRLNRASIQLGVHYYF